MTDYEVDSSIKKGGDQRRTNVSNEDNGLTLRVVLVAGA